MGNEVDKKFTWVIKNFNSIQSDKIYSDSFLIGGCKWRLMAFPRGNNNANYLSLYLRVADSEYLPNGWRRHVKYSLTVANHFSDKFSEVKETLHWFEQKEDDWGFTSMLTLGKLKAKSGGFLVNGDVKIVAEVNVLEVIGKLDVLEELGEATHPLKKTKPNDDDGSVTSNLVKETPADWVDVNGFQLLPSQVDLARRIFERHPEIALEIRTKNQDLRTSYMNVLLSLIKMLFKYPQEHSKDDLSDAEASLAYMTSVGFKVDWLKKKLDELKEYKKKCDRVCEMEQELLDLKQRCKDLETQLVKDKAEILDATAPDLSFSDVI